MPEVSFLTLMVELAVLCVLTNAIFFFWTMQSR